MASWLEPITALFRPRAGIATAGRAPLVFTAGTNLSVPESGAVEFDGVGYYLTGSDAIRTVINRKLISARTYYVRTDGSDSNTGLANSSGEAFLTIQKAVDTVVTLDNGGFLITIQVGDGTYTGAVVLASFIGTSRIRIQGNNGTPANVVISTTSADGIQTSGVIGDWDIRDLKIQTTTGGTCLSVAKGSRVFHRNLNFGASAASHILATLYGSVICEGSYAISGGATAHMSARGGEIDCTGFTLTITGTPAFSTAFADAQRLGLVNLVVNTYTGSATGVRYSATGNAVVNTSGAGATALPGNAAGTTATGGQYL